MTNAKRILIIDDSPDDLEFYADLLSNCKSRYEVITCESANEGLAILKNQEIHCTFIDYNMPEMDGVEALNKFRRDISKNTAIVILTGEPHQKVQAEAARKGALDYIVKDSHNSSEQLEQIINKVLRWTEDK